MLPPRFCTPLILVLLAGCNRVEETNQGAAVGQPAANLGLCYEQGLGLPQDQAEAVKLFSTAAKGGDPRAMLYLPPRHEDGRGVTMDRAQALTWYRKAVALGNAEARARVEKMK